MAITLVEPWSFDIVLHRQNYDVTVKLGHVLLQLHEKACAVSPAHPRRSVIIYHDRRVEVIPPSSRTVVCH